MQKSATACARLRSANAPDASWSLLDGTTPSSLLFARRIPREPQTSIFPDGFLTSQTGFSRSFGTGM